MMTKKKTHKCSKDHDKCAYGGKCAGVNCCDYYLIYGVGHRRECSPEECDKFENKTGNRKVRPEV